MTQFIATTRDSSLAQQIYSVYESHLGESLKGIIMCGGAGKPDAQDYLSSDIDYLVIVQELNVATISALSESQEELGTMHKARPSHTVLTLDELTHADEIYPTLDGKAVQAIIEAQTQDLAGISIEQMPRLSEAALIEFSTQNLFVLQALLRKTVVRADVALTDTSKVSMAKIALIVQKMYKQALGDDFTEVWAGRNELEKLKLHPADYSDEAAREVILKLLNLRI